MAVLVDEQTRLAVAGITGREGSFHTLNNRRYGTNVVGGVTPGKGGQDVEGIPVFDSWAQAAQEVQPNTAMIFVPPRFAADSILEAAAAGVELVIAITEGIPAHDELRVYNVLRARASGHAPDRAELPRHPLARQGERGHHPGVVLQAGQRRRGVALGHADLPDRQRDRPGRLRLQLDRRHRRRSGAGIVVRGHAGAVQADEQTELIVLSGEIGGSAEEEAAEYIADHVTKPVVAYIAGFTAPAGKQMGHAGAIVSGSAGTAAAKAKALEAKGVRGGAHADGGRGDRGRGPGRAPSRRPDCEGGSARGRTPAAAGGSPDARM